MTNSIPAACSVLFARTDSIYKALGCDVWDLERNALLWPGGNPVIAHPPCRSWGTLRKLAKPRPGEKALAAWAVYQVREFGGVLEHPANSRLWPELNLPRPGEVDEYEGWTYIAPQWWWGHRAEKLTRFYIVGTRNLPEVPYRIGEAERVVTNRKGIRKGHPSFKTEITKQEREATRAACV